MTVLFIIDFTPSNTASTSLSHVPCTLSVPTRSPLESLELTFGLKCKGPTRYALPVTF